MGKQKTAWLALLLLLFSLAAPKSSAEQAVLTPNRLLSTAFTLLEEGNPFQERYNRITGEEVKSRLPLGVPYLWGGRAASHLFAKEPDYVVLPLWTNSRVYYRAGRNYIYGFDCVGFLHWVWEEATGTSLPTLDEMLRLNQNHVSNSDSGAPALQAANLLQAGDILVMDHPERHVAFYVGTLRMYGYTAEEIPELSGFLDDPLVIHCTVNAQISERFQKLIDEGLPKYRSAWVTDGGVCVSLLTAKRSDAPNTVLSQEQLTSYSILPSGAWLTVLPCDEITQYAWVRMDDTH